MKKLLFIAIVTVFLFSSCSPVKIAHIEGERIQATPSEFAFENDSVKITYRFWARKGRMDFDIYNKLSIPLYVDWKTSAYIANDKMISYYRDETNTESVSAYYAFTRYAVAGASASKSIHKERISVIPPKSMITENSYFLVKQYADLPEKGSYQKSNSPLRFRNYITLSNNEKFEGHRATIDNSFYVRDIKMISSSKFRNHKSGKAFYYPKTYSVE